MTEEIHPKMYMYKRVVDAKVFIDGHYSEKIDLDQISDRSSFSKYHFLRLFKNAFGLTPHQYLTEVRIEAAKKMLREDIAVNDVCFQVGFESIPSFINLFKKREGITPKEFARKHQQMEKEKAATPLSFVPNCFVENFGWGE